MISNITNTDGLRHELIKDYFEDVLLGSCPAFKTKVNKRLIESIIVEKAKGEAFRQNEKSPEYLEGCCSKPIINLRNNIWKYYKAFKAYKESKNFDKWFFATAKKFIEDCKAEGGTVSFGNAQKIINITLKHLYAYARKSKISHFKFCHFTLDSYTYGAYYRKQNGFYEDIKSEKVKTCWTKLSESEYTVCQKDIRDYFVSPSCAYKDDSNANLTPFEAEFIIWQEYKKKSI